MDFASLIAQGLDSVLDPERCLGPCSEWLIPQ